MSSLIARNETKEIKRLYLQASASKNDNYGLIGMTCRLNDGTIGALLPRTPPEQLHSFNFLSTPLPTQHLQGTTNFHRPPNQQPHLIGARRHEHLPQPRPQRWRRNKAKPNNPKNTLNLTNSCFIAITSTGITLYVTLAFSFSPFHIKASLASP